MTKGELIKSIFKPAIEWAAKKIWTWLASIITVLAIFFLSVKNILIEHPNVLLVLLFIMTATTVLFLILWIRMYWQHRRFREAFGVYWDRNYNMRCLSCKKPLKHSSNSEQPHKLWCSDPECNSKYILKKADGTEMTPQEAIDCLIQDSKGDNFINQ